MKSNRVIITFLGGDSSVIPPGRLERSGAVIFCLVGFVWLIQSTPVTTTEPLPYVKTYPQRYAKAYEAAIGRRDQAVARQLIQSNVLCRSLEEKMQTVANVDRSFSQD